MTWKMMQHLLFATIVLAAQPALADNPQQQVDRARLTLEEMLHAPDFSAVTMLSRAKALLIVPELSKGGFLIGGQGGGGLLIARRPGRGWSAPAFFSLGGATLGLQVGFQTAKMVFFVMTEKALQNLLNGDFKFCAQDGNAVFVTGTQHFDGKTSQGADIVVWARATGAYAGITVEGTSVSYNLDQTRSYYGKTLSAAEVVRSSEARNRGTDALREVVTRADRR